MSSVRIKRGTRAQIASAAAANGLKQGELYHVTDENRVDVGTGTGASSALATKSEVDGKEPTIPAGTTAQYWRGDKTWQPLNKSAVGLGNVDNTSDANKPVSTAQQAALDAKQDALVSGTNIKTVNGASILGGGDLIIAGGSSLVRYSRTSNTQLVAADSGKWIDITSGTFTQTFAAAATLGDGWFCYLGNSGTGDITLDPDGAETIDGLTSYVMYPGEVRLVQCDGAELRSIVLNSFYKVFETSGTLTVPPGYRWLDTLTWGGGNSGQKTGTASNALGGGGGGCFPATIPVEILGASVAITVGAGGAARTANQTGAKGGASSIGSFVVVCMSSGTSTPEYGGAVTAAGTAPMEPEGSSTSAFGRSPAGSGNQSVYGGTSAATTGAGAKAVYGAGCGGSTNGATAYAGGTSIFGGNGGAAGDAVSGVDGSIPGGGGGGTRTGTQSGAGARGEVRIWGVI